MPPNPSQIVSRITWSLLGTSSLAATFLRKSDEPSIASFRPEDCRRAPLYLVNASVGDSEHPLLPIPEQGTQSKWETNWDKRDPVHLFLQSNLTRSLTQDEQEEEIKKYTPKANRHVILIRHGQYKNSGTTDEERALTVLGREQAALTGNRLKEMGLPFEQLINSTMQRAKETSDVIAEHFPGVSRSEDHLLREGAAFPPEPKPKFYAPHEHEFYRDGARIEAGFRKYFHRADVSSEHDTYTVLVCHANVIRYFVCRALQFPPESWLRFTLKNSSITWLMIRPTGNVILHTFGDTGFMPPDKVTVQ